MKKAHGRRQQKQAKKPAKNKKRDRLAASSDIQAIFQDGLKAHQAGQLAAAEAAYRRVLELDADHADANHLLGVIAHQAGDNESAVELIGKAIRHDPSTVAYHNNLGTALHELGRLDEAEASQRQAIQLNPDYAKAHNNLANVLLDQGCSDDAIISYRKALSIVPGDAETHVNLGNALTKLDQLENAEASYRKAIALNPDYAEAHTSLGNVLMQQKRPDDAVTHFQKAISLRPELFELHTNLGFALKEVGLLDDAIASHRKAIAINPDYAEVHTNLGNILKEAGHLEDAIASHEKAILLKPDLAEAHNNLGVTLREQENLDMAVACHEKAIRLKPDLTEAHNSLGVALRELGRMKEAEAACRRAIELKPEFFEAHVSLGSVLEGQDRLEEGEAACRRAIELKPDYAQAHFNLALFLFRKGNLKEAWDEYKWRWHISEYSLPSLAYPQPRWDGSPLDGKSILLWGEQGIGDVIRYAGMIPDVLETGASVSIVCDGRLVDIFARSFNDAHVLAAPPAETDASADVFDFQCPYGSLGKFLRPNHDSFPADQVGYLKADPELMKFWKQRLSGISDRPKIGLAWSGASKLPMRVLEYASIEELAPILTLDDVDFINLQSHDSHEDINEARERYGADIHSWDDLDLRNDLNEVAALTSGLDLVISFQTFSSEFAGALGVPTLCFVYHKETVEELGTGDAIWYPQVHYVSKERSEPWKGTLEEIAKIAKKKLGL